MKVVQFLFSRNVFFVEHVPHTFCQSWPFFTNISRVLPSYFITLNEVVGF